MVKPVIVTTQLANHVPQGENRPKYELCIVFRAQSVSSRAVGMSVRHKAGVRRGSRGFASGRGRTWKPSALVDALG
jgi:hypothetical protein